MKGLKTAHFSMNAPIELFHGFENVPNEWPNEEIKLVRHKVFYYTFIYMYVHLDVYICLHTCIYSVYVNMYIWIPMCIYAFTHILICPYFMYIFIYMRGLNFLLGLIIFILCICIFFLCILCASHACLVPVYVTRGGQIPWNWNHGWLWFTMWSLCFDCCFFVTVF